MHDLGLVTKQAVGIADTKTRHVSPLARTDVLSDVLQTVQLSGTLLGRVEMGAPYGVTSEGVSGPMFHFILSGSGFVALAGNDPVPMGTGDLLMFPHGDVHALQSDSTTRRVRFVDLRAAYAASEQDVMRTGGNGAVTAMTCGRLSFDRGELHPLLAQLPPLIHVRGGGSGTQLWLETTSRLISNEIRDERMGSAALMDRLGGVLFIQVIRAYVESLPSDHGGWLNALRDRRVGRALTCIHEAPEHPWSVASLAAKAGMSRSAFASRFKALVHQTPLQYLTGWRMHRAAFHLRTGAMAVAEIADRVGYDSHATFSKAFKRHVGEAPTKYRVQSRDPGSAMFA